MIRHTSKRARPAIRAAALLSALALAGAGEAAAQTFPYDQSFPVQSGETLTLRIETGGRIRVTGTDAQRVRVRAVDRRSCDDCRLDVQRTSSGVEVHSYHEERNRRNRSSSLEFEVEVPRRYDVRVSSMGGAVDVRDVEGRITGRTMGGELELRGLKGHLDLQTMGGAIRLRGSDVDGRLHTMGGAVLMEDVIGDVRASTMGGSVTQRRVTRRAASGAATGGTSSTGQVLTMNTMGGDIQVAEAPHGANLRTMGGKVRLGSAGGPVRITTMGGDIFVGAVDGSVHATTMGGNVEVTMVGDPNRGDRAVHISSMGGDIDLTVPAGLSMDIEVKIHHEARRRGRYRVISDFPLQQTERQRTDRNREMVTLEATGTVGDGRHRIVISTFDGNVRLRRQ